MPEENEYYDLIFPCALGCLDKEDLERLNEYQHSDGDFDWQELGEYQNLVALLPSILNIETPDVKLKDKVALKLYKLNAERQTKNESPSSKASAKDTARRKEILADDDIKELGEKIKYETSKPEELENNESDFRGRKRNTQIIGREGDIAGLKKAAAGEEEIKLHIEEKEKPLSAKSDVARRLLLEAEEESRKKKNTLPVILAILFFIAATALAVVYFQVSSQVKAYKSNVEKLSAQVKNLSNKPDKNQGLEEILKSDDVKIINLIGTAINPAGSGNIIISFEKNKGFLKLSKMPSLSDNQGYQLWQYQKGNYVSLGTFNPVSEVKYFPFTIPQLPAQTGQRTIIFIVTAEPSGGSAKPGTKMYLSGVLK